MTRKLAEEAVDLPPHLRPAGEPVPVGAKHADEAEALIDGSAEIEAIAREAVDEQGLDIGLELLRSTGLRSTMALQEWRSSEDSITPPGLGYCATTRPAALL